MTFTSDDLLNDIMDLFSDGHYCAQILAILVLEELGKDSQDLVQAMSGMTGGMGFSGEACGILTGGSAILGYVYGSADGSPAHPRLQPIVNSYVEWFRAHIAATYGGTACGEILADEPENQWLRCGQLLAEAFEALMDIIDHEGVPE